MPGVHLQALLAGVGAPDAPVFAAIVVPPLLEQEFISANSSSAIPGRVTFGPKVAAKTPNEVLVPPPLGGKYAKDLRGNAIFIRQTVRDKLLAADAAMFAKKHEHIKVNFGF